MITAEKVVEQTKSWITNVVIGCNFCPFAAREVKRGSVHYTVEWATDVKTCLQTFLLECDRLDKNENIETTFVILPKAVPHFNEYLHLVSMAEKLVKKSGYEGIYQVASFHPLYSFGGAPAKDAANYTNRSIYPMLHLLREDSIEKVLERYPDPEGIPERNIAFARTKGETYMRLLRDSCL
jgi:uncharacterized protein